MRQIALLSCFIIGFSCLGFSQEEITVKGFLKDSLTNEPIANASIIFGKGFPLYQGAWGQLMLYRY